MRFPSALSANEIVGHHALVAVARRGFDQAKAQLLTYIFGAEMESRQLNGHCSLHVPSGFQHGLLPGLVLVLEV